MPDEFEKYTDIEANLRNIYNSGYFSDVDAVVERQGMTAYVNYVLEPNPRLMDSGHLETYQTM